MTQLRYIEEPITLELDASLCNGCGLCLDVCPRACFAMVAKRAKIVDRGTCLECGAENGGPSYIRCARDEQRTNDRAVRSML